MTAANRVGSRAELLERLFPGGVPRLWCPPITHYDAEGAIDRERCAAHLAFVARHARGLLVPGSTGDGWELTPEEGREIIDLALAEAGRLGVHVLVGALRPDAAEAAAVIREWAARVAPGARQLTAQGRGAAAVGTGESQLSAAAWPVGAACGFAVCPPRGAHLSQADLETSLSGLLALGAPLALYQLPQVTENEMGPVLVADLARRFPGFVLFKDTSGDDRVATAGRTGLDLGGVFLVRGAEGGYSRHLRTAGGGYDGFLLSTANSFGEELAAIIELSAMGRRAEADARSERLSSLVGELFRVVADIPRGNAFANAAKAADHFSAYGARAANAPPPRLHGGGTLPHEVLAATEDALRRHDLLPARGYLE